MSRNPKGTRIELASWNYNRFICAMGMYICNVPFPNGMAPTLSSSFSTDDMHVIAALYMRWSARRGNAAEA